MSFQTAVTSAITRHGLPLSYTSVTTGSYNVETGTPGITRVSYTLTMYPKHFIANNYNYPERIQPWVAGKFFAGTTLRTSYHPLEVYCQ